MEMFYHYPKTASHTKTRPGYQESGHLTLKIMIKKEFNKKTQKKKKKYNNKLILIILTRTRVRSNNISVSFVVRNLKTFDHQEATLQANTRNRVKGMRDQ